MHSHVVYPRFCQFLSAALVALVMAGSAFANNGDGGNGGDGDGDIIINSNVAGVEIDPRGVLRMRQGDPRVTAARLRAAKRGLPSQLSNPSPLRKVSLNRLEQVVAERLAAGEQPSADMVAMAGLTRLEYVFFYPESGDIVLAGPAEGFGRDSVGRIVGVESGRPCILLDDVIVALRAFAPTGDRANSISVSIDPTQEGLARMQQALQQLGSNFRSAADIPVIVNTLRQSLGMNDVTVKGIPAGTHFAHVLTEADYRMKLIGIGLENPPVPMKSYVAALTASMTSSNALVRWYFVPDYEALAVSQDGNAVQLVGKGVKLVGEDELVGRDGSRKASGRAANPASRIFTNEFTEKFEMIAQRSEVYSQLRNLVDLTIAAAFIQDADFYGKAGWDLGVLADEDALSVEVFPAPEKVETAINAVIKGRRLITPIGGGVSIQARKALDSENLKRDAGNRIEEQRTTAASLDELAPNQWWWD